MSGSVLSPPEPRVHAGRVLVIDDSAFFRGLLAGMLQSDGHEVLDAQAGEDLGALLDADERPDLVLLDLDLTEGRGRRILKQIRDRFSPDELPVLALTEVVSSDRDLDRLGELGCAGALNKLAPPEHVRFRVRSAMHPPTEEERSRRRVALSLGVRYRVVGTAEFARTHTVSPDGVFVRSANPPPLGAEVELRLELREPTRTLLVAGEVVRRETGGDENSPSGFAVHFTKIAPEDRNALAELLARVHDAGL